MGGACAARRRAWAVVALLAAPVLALAPAGQAQDEACRPEGEALRCVWEGMVPVQVPYTGVDAQGCPRERTLIEHAFRLPFPARVELNVTLQDTIWINFNDFILYLDGPSGTINRTYPSDPYPQTLSARILEPVDLVARLTIDGSLNTPTHPVVPAPEPYRLEALITPAAADADWRLDEAMFVGYQMAIGTPFGFQPMPKNAYAITCWDYGYARTLPVDSPGLVELEMQFVADEGQLPPGDVRVKLSDALGAPVMDLRAGLPAERLGFVAAEGHGWGDWLLTIVLDDRVGVSDTFQIHTNITGQALDPARVRVPEPRIPRDLLVADPRDDVGERALDVLGGWFSDDQADAVVFHVLLADVPEWGLAPTPDGVRRYEAGWRYAGAQVVLSFEAERGRPPVFHAYLEGEGADRLSAVPGRLTPGAPGVLSFLLPKRFIGSPADGKIVDGITLATYEFQAGAMPVSPPLLAMPDDLRGGFVASDTTEGNASYLVGSAAPVLDAGVEAPLAPATAGAVASPWEALRGMDGLLGLASAVCLGAFGLAAALHRRR